MSHGQPAATESKVFNLGLSKTGTTSIERALEFLGYRVAKGHWKYNYCFYLSALAIHRDFDEIIRFTKSFDAFCDGPWSGSTDLHKRLVKEYPNAHYMLSLRDPEKWYRSLVNMLTIFDRNEETAIESYSANGMWGSAYWFRHVYGIEKLAGSQEKVIAFFNDYNNKVVKFFKDRSIPLQVFDLSSIDPWTVLCSFLGKDKPDAPFPRMNVTPKDWELTRKNVVTAVSRSLDLKKPLGE